jgi:hypothetical protein
VFIKQRVRTSIGMVVVAAIAIVAIFSSQTFAQSTTDSSADVIKVSPLRSDITIAPGASQNVPITISNPTSSAIEITPVENDFTSADEEGNPALILNANTFAPTHSLKRFMAPLSPITIPAGKGVTITVLITVPKTAQAGGYFGAIRLTPTSLGSGGQVNLSANAASLILLTVPGPTVEKLALTDFDIQQNGKTGTNFTTPSNLEAYIRFENKGNLQEGPFGVIDVKNGSKIVYEDQFNTTEPRDVILPDGARRWDVPLKNVGTFGYYSVTATLAYGATNQTIEVTKSFWIIPTYVIIGAIVAAIILIAVIILIIVLVRRRRRRIIRQRSLGGGGLRR